MRIFKTFIIAAAVVTTAVGGLASPAHAQRSQAYAAARQAGKVGEKPDGYLGVVGSQSQAIQKLVDSINIKRKAHYTDQASSGGTVEQRAFVAGCNLIARTKSGEKYMTPGGAWKTRTSAPPERDSRCV